MVFIARKPIFSNSSHAYIEKRLGNSTGGEADRAATEDEPEDALPLVPFLGASHRRFASGVKMVRVVVWGTYDGTSRAGGHAGVLVEEGKRGLMDGSDGGVPL